MLSTGSLAVVALALASPAMGQLSRMRGTIPGALHQCENTNIVFFDTGGARPLDVLFLPSSSVPDSFRTGTITVDQALAASPLLAIDGIPTADAAPYPFELQIAEGTVFEVFGFLPDGSGKALSLTRTVMTPLPGATQCLTNIPTTIAGAGGAGATTAAPAATTTSATRAPRTSAAASSMATSASSSSSVARSSSASSSAASSAANSASPAAASATVPSSAGVLSKTVSGNGAYAWAAGLGGLGAVAEFLFF